MHTEKFDFLKVWSQVKNNGQSKMKAFEVSQYQGKKNIFGTRENSSRGRVHACQEHGQILFKDHMCLPSQHYDT